MTIYKVFVFGTLILIGLCIIVGWMAAWLLIVLPLTLLWHERLGRMANLMGRHTTNRFTRGLAEWWIIVGYPIPPLAFLAVFAPSVGAVLFIVGMALWLALALWDVIAFWGKPLKRWKDYR